ncbi:MAG: hypothetical protein ACLTTO_12505 [Lachnospiraceae bacterium]
MRKKFGYQAMAAIFAAAMIVSGAGMYRDNGKSSRRADPDTAAENSGRNTGVCKTEGRSRIRRSDRGRRIHSDL